VCSKLIYGSLRVKSFSPVQVKEPSDEPNTVIASLDTDDIKSTADNPWLLTPIVGNVHEFEAQSNCVIFELLLPPYDVSGCKFFSEEIVQLDESQNRYKLTEIPECAVTAGLPTVTSYFGYTPC